MRTSRRRVFLVVVALFAAGITALALADREAAYMTLYGLGAVLLLLGSAAGFGGSAAGYAPGSSSDTASVHRSAMEQRLGGLSMSFLLLVAGAFLIGIAVLLNLA